MANDDPDWEYCEGKRLHLRPHPGTHREPWNWRSIAAAAGLAGGLAAIVFGTLAGVAGWLEGRVGYGTLLMWTGTLLLVVSIPLLAAGAHCLDLEERHAAAGHARRDKSGANKGRGR